MSAEILEAPEARASGGERGPIGGPIFDRHRRAMAVASQK